MLSSAHPGDEPADVFIYDPLAVVPRTGGHSCCVPTPRRWARRASADAETSKTMLVYTTAPLERDLVLIGDAHATLYAASSAVDTDFAVRLCVVDGTAARATCRRGSCGRASATR